MTAPESIKQLVKRFDENREAYRSGRYNEAQLRVEFLNPFFEALGWDVFNKKGYALDYREVVTEDSIEIQGQAKAPDYAFKIGRERKFFVEAKKPSVDIAGDIHPAYQLRRYAWNVHLPLSILTDFEEFAVYDCRNRPNPNDPAATGRTMFFRYRDYIDHWDEIAGIFSREAVLKGSFDKYALENKGKKGTTEVDDAFLEDIEAWRTLLARVIALRNPAVADEQQLNYAVQMTIDRIIFLRICEDRGIEPEFQLQTIAKSAGIYSQLIELFKRADTRYNSGLFHFHAEKGQVNGADTFTPSLKIDDKTLKEIINRMYYPCPYIFKEIPVEILGQVYEQFLGKVIRLTAGHQAKVEEKPEVRKAGGVYYTPAYIVKYIVENTLGRLLEGRTPAEAVELKLVDPACGSGSFLLGAYQYLLNWHEDWYAAHDPEQWAKGRHPALVQVNGGAWKLTTEEKKKILVNTIHGVDIDPQAVEVTKLSLLLKVLEEESGQLTLGFERVLPDLGNNIKCGNSLIGEDYFEGRLAVDENERRRVNPFDWQRAFPQVFAKGGFDAVIGNPPYGATLSENIGAYLNEEFNAFRGTKDIYTAFIQLSLNILMDDGLSSFIVPTAWVSGPNYLNLRQFVVLKKIEKAILLPFDIFADAYIDTMIFVIKNAAPKSADIVKTYVFPKHEKISTIQLDNCYMELAQVKWQDDKDNKFVLNPEVVEILNKIRATTNIRFSDVLTMKRGVLFDKKLLISDQRSKAFYRYFGGDVYRYVINSRFSGWLEFNDKLKEKPKEFKWFENERLLLRRLVNRQQRLMASLATDTYITNKNLYSILPSSEHNVRLLLGLINSKLISYIYLNQITQATKDDFPQVTIVDFLALPFPKLDGGSEKQTHLIQLVQRMLDLHKQMPATPFEQERLQRQIQATDNEIDRLVYELYDLTPEEVKIVEGG